MMINSNHPFDPSLQPVFSNLAGKALNTLPDSRDLFFALLHSSEQSDILPAAYCYLRQQLQAVERQYAGQLSKVFLSQSLDALEVLVDETELSCYQSLNHYRPVIETEFVYLQAACQVATNQTPLAADVMAVSLQLLGKQSYLPLFEGALHLSGLYLPALHSRAFIKQADIKDSFFDFAAIQLALMAHCRVFFAEMLGFALACCKTNLFTGYEAEAAIRQFVTARQSLIAAQVPALETIIHNYLGQFPEQIDTLWQRIQCGFYLYQQQILDCQNQATQHALVSPQQAVIELLAMIAPTAVGHHSQIKLADKGLDEWFAQQPFDSPGFLAALRQSPYVNKTNPERSVLLRLFEFGGPMFGVLNHNQRQLLLAWLLSDFDEQHASQLENQLRVVETACQNSIALDSTEYSQLSHRQLYYYLVNADVYPAVLTKARQYVHSVLWRAQYLNRLPFKHYSHQAFADYIQGIYQAEVDSYQPLQQAPKLSKQAYLWGIEQFAPAILTDGCWLQHARQLALLANGTIADLLYKIYDDETGNGILLQNHPVIYQQLLDSVGIHVPPVNSKAFCGHTEFIDSAFDLPVYLMAISKFPSAFLPELLGLNMAIEISGLGKVYLRLAQELRYYGINSAIVDVHISIDNLATGHSALAIKAIQCYMDDVLANHGKRVMQNHWRRIYSGYCSLQTASAVFKYALVVEYWLKRKHKVRV